MIKKKIESQYSIIKHCWPEFIKTENEISSFQSQTKGWPHFYEINPYTIATKTY